MFEWDASPYIFDWNVPFLGRPVLWYGFLFALGFLLGYFVLLWVLKQENVKHAKQIAEKLTFYVVVATVIGARAFDVIFYESWSKIAVDPLTVFKVWEGGLASHGAVCGILVALYVFLKKMKKEIPKLSWRKLLDWMALPAGVIAFFIRLGNFINQEVLGKPTTVPWAVRFGHPLDGSAPVPRHPVQLYEAFYYVALFGVFFCLYRKRGWKEGQLGGLFIVLVFVFRFFIEFLKEEQSVWIAQGSFFTMGQLLSLPLIFLGLYLLFCPSHKHS